MELVRICWDACLIIQNLVSIFSVKVIKLFMQQMQWKPAGGTSEVFMMMNNERYAKPINCTNSQVMQHIRELNYILTHNLTCLASFKIILAYSYLYSAWRMYKKQIIPSDIIYGGYNSETSVLRLSLMILLKQVHKQLNSYCH